MKKFDEALLTIDALTVKLREDFLAVVQDTSKPIIERLTLWDDYAANILPTENWLSSCPKWLEEARAEHLGRGAIISFTDLSEELAYGFEGEVTFDDKDNIIGVSDKLATMLEEVFSTGLRGTAFDW